MLLLEIESKSSIYFFSTKIHTHGEYGGSSPLIPSLLQEGQYFVVKEKDKRDNANPQNYCTGVK
jgi:hypothetical protein